MPLTSRQPYALFRDTKGKFFFYDSKGDGVHGPYDTCTEAAASRTKIYNVYPIRRTAKRESTGCGFCDKGQRSFLHEGVRYHHVRTAYFPCTRIS
jgi:hypothetical protein